MTDERPLKAVPRRNRRGHKGTIAQRSAAGARLARTVLLGVIALGAGLWYLTDTFGVDRKEWLGYGVTAFGIVIGLVIAAALMASLLRLLRKR